MTEPEVIVARQTKTVWVRLILFMSNLNQVGFFLVNVAFDLVLVQKKREI